MKLLRFFKGSSLLNILGMTAAFAALYILLVQVNYDLGYNKNIKDADRLYIMAIGSWHNEGRYQTGTNRPFSKAICESTPLVESWGVAEVGEIGASSVFVGENRDGAEFKFCTYQMTENAFEVFGFEAVQGTFKGMGKEPKAAICEKAAEVMGVGIGDMIWLDGYGYPFTVGAIYRAPSKNSDIGDAQVICSLNYEEQSLDNFSEWGYRHFVKLHSAEDKEAFEAHALEVIKREAEKLFSMNPAYTPTQQEKDDYINRAKITLIPITDLYFNKLIDSPAGRSGNLTTTLTLLGVAVLIVLITLINFVNFFMAQVPQRIRSVNTKKVLGSSRGALIGGFMLESGVLVAISFLLAAAVVLLFKSSTYANLISCPLDFEANMFVVVLSFAVALIMTVASSVYPAFYITSFPPALAIKSGFGMSQSGRTLRYSLIGLQFVISLSFVICAIFIKMQHSYMMNYDMGFDKENLYSMLYQIQDNSQRDAFNDELLKNPAIKDVTWAGGPMVQPATRMGWGRMFKGEQINFDAYPVAWNFLDFMGIEITEGRNFSRADEQSEDGVFIFNQVAKESFGFTLEDRVQGHTNNATEIAGFCKNAKIRPLQYSDQPFAFYVFGKNPWWALYRLYVRSSAGATYQDVVEAINGAMLKIDPNFDINRWEVNFYDKELGAQYQKEQDLTTMVNLFTVLAIIISLMGVFGLVVFETQYRRKEIGVRRVHGATIGGVIKMFNIRFLKILGICFLIAAPISYLIVNSYYSTFAYSSPIYWWVFALALAAVGAIIVAVVTLSSYRAATENPVESLKAE